MKAFTPRPDALTGALSSDNPAVQYLAQEWDTGRTTREEAQLEMGPIRRLFGKVAINGFDSEMLGLVLDAKDGVLTLGDMQNNLKKSGNASHFARF